jgi:hypothetical protein
MKVWERGESISDFWITQFISKWTQYAIARITNIRNPVLNTDRINAGENRVKPPTFVHPLAFA